MHYWTIGGCERTRESIHAGLECRRGHPALKRSLNRKRALAETALRVFVARPASDTGERRAVTRPGVRSARRRTSLVMKLTGLVHETRAKSLSSRLAGHETVAAQLASLVMKLQQHSSRLAGHELQQHGA